MLKRIQKDPLLRPDTLRNRHHKIAPDEYRSNQN
jgi:hypothetical protein